MKRALGVSLAVAFAISAISAPVLGAPSQAQGGGAGLFIQKACGMTYGELWQTAKAAGGHSTPIGPKRLIDAIVAGGHPLPGFCTLPD